MHLLMPHNIKHIHSQKYFIGSKSLHCKCCTGRKWSSRVRLRWKLCSLDEIWNSVSQMWGGGGLALADFGHDPRSSNSLRGIIFTKRHENYSQNFQVLRLQAIITQQWLQIAANSLPSGLSTGCLVSIFTIRINLKHFPWTVHFVQKR